MSVLGIAFESGFNSKTAFNTMFKKIMGITPSEFRKNQKESDSTDTGNLNSYPEKPF